MNELIEDSSSACKSAGSRSLFRQLAFLVTATVLVPAAALAQGPPRGFWSVPDASAAHTNAQKAETEISTDTVEKQFKLLWKLKLGNEAGNAASFSEPVLVPGMITGKGFKDFLFWADANTLYAVDSELGSLVWQHDVKSQAKACGGTMMQLATEAPQVIHFGARRPAATPGQPAPPPPPPETPVPAAERHVGASAGGGYFGLKGVYVVSSDGYVHEQIMATGLDYAPPVKFVGASAGPSFGLNLNEKILYASTGTGCKNGADTLWSINLNSQDYKINSYKSGKAGLVGLAGPAIGADGTAYVVTGAGPSDPAAGTYSNSVVALTSDGLKARDWYTSAPGKALSTGAIVFPVKDKQMVAAARRDGSLVLLDAEALGGSDHKTALAETKSIAKAGKHGGWDGLATWQDKSGTVWLFASIQEPLDPAAKLSGDNGSATHGAIVAFKVEEQDGHPALIPAWSSRDLVNPAPPVAANGVILALEGGSASGHATLYVLDAATGKQLFSSGDAVATYAHKAGLAVGDGHVFFTTHDNTLYSFGIPLEH